jgi:hypothetical protein
VAAELLALAGDNPRAVVWAPEDRAFDVPDELAEAYVAPAKAKKATKAAKATPPPKEE